MPVCAHVPATSSWAIAAMALSQVLLTAVFVLLHQRRLGYADVGLSYDRVSQSLVGPQQLSALPLGRKGARPASAHCSWLVWWGPLPSSAVASSPHLALPKVVSHRELWRCAACQLLHIDLLHLLFNLSALWSIGEGLPGTPRTASPQGGAPRTPGNRAALRSARSH